MNISSIISKKCIIYLYLLIHMCFIHISHRKKKLKLIFVFSITSRIFLLNLNEYDKLT